MGRWAGKVTTAPTVVERDRYGPICGRLMARSLLRLVASCGSPAEITSTSLYLKRYGGRALRLSELTLLRLRLVPPERHSHLAEHRRRGAEMLADLLMLGRAPAELAEADVTVGDEWAHAKFRSPVTLV